MNGRHDLDEKDTEAATKASVPSIAGPSLSSGAASAESGANRLSSKTALSSSDFRTTTAASPADVPAELGRRADLAPRVARLALVLADLGAIVIGFMATFGVQAAFRPVPEFVRTNHAIVAALSVPVWLGALVFTKSYVARQVDRASQEVSCILRSARIVVGVIVVASFFSQFQILSRLWVATMLVTVTTALLIERALARMFFQRLRRQGRMTRRILIAGTGTDAISLLHSIKSDPSLGYDVVGFLGNEDIGEREGCRVLGSFDDAQLVLEQVAANGVLVSVASLEPNVVNRLTRELTDAGVHVALSSSLYDIDIARFRPQELGGRTLFYVERTVRHGWRAVAKRAFDVVVASLVLLVTTPILAVAALLVKRSPGPVIFRQERVGLGGAPFTIFKLRTMCAEAEELKHGLQAQNEADGPLFKITHDPRITPVGRVLRKLSIDELPQLWNVLRGDMSLVGPRPALPSEVVEWQPQLHERLRVLPGITGMWQVHGRSDTSFDDYARLDLYYVDNWSLGKDLGIMARTVAVVAKSKGAS